MLLGLHLATWVGIVVTQQDSQAVEARRILADRQTDLGEVGETLT